MECKFTPEQIKGKIEDNVAKLATDTRLFERIGNTLVPTIDDDALVNSALQYKDEVKIPIYKDLLSSNTRQVLQDISNQYFGRTETGQPSTFGVEGTDENHKAAIKSFGQSLVDIATKIYPLSTSPSHGEVRGDINRQYGDEVIKKAGGLYSIDIPENIVNEALKQYNLSLQGNPTPQVQYALKSAEILASERAAQVFKIGDKNGWTVEKMLTELQIPAAQKELLLSFNTRNREELLTTLLANYSYTVEINIAMDSDSHIHTGNRALSQGDGTYDVMYEGTYLGDLTRNQIVDKLGEEVTSQLINSGEREFPAQNYPNMTVPGGTNYTENEIRTPDITPSIKGHAAFATNQGIGWFRSDEQRVGGRFVPGVKEEYGSPETYGGTDTNTRRILEIQSDLFQKGRDRRILSNAAEGTADDISFGDENFNKIVEERTLKGEKEVSNQFLQLLNKDSNWVSFFIKSIIQDSAKKGYEKVLFPTGDTAAKVEGHETISGFIESRERLLKDIQEQLTKINNDAFTYQDVHAFAAKVDGEKIYSIGGNRTDEATYEEHKERVLDTFYDRELQFKDELAQARAGTLKISSIAKFYEDTIKNILDKRGYKPERIKDEYGNEWYQIEVTPELAQQFLFGNPLTDEQREILYDEKRLYEEAGIEVGESPLQFIQKFSMHQEQITSFLKANPNVKVEWGDEFSVFDQNTNIISIALPELYEISARSGIPFKTIISYYIMHEMGHAGAYYAMKKGNDDQLPTQLLNMVREFHKTQPFEDKLRQGYVEDGIPYSMKNIDEFVSDAFSNPFFQEYLKQIPYEKENKTLWDKFIDWALSLLGVKRDSVYDKVINYINSSKIQRDNLEGMLTPDWVDMEVYYRGNPKDYISATYEYFTSPKIKDEVTEIFKKLPESIAKLKALEKLQNDPLQRGKIQSLLNAFNEVKGKESVIPVYVNMLVQASRMAKDVEDQMIAAGKMEDGMAKITLLNSLLTTAQNFEFITPLVTDILTEMNTAGLEATQGLATFIGQIKRITDVQSRLKRMFIRLVTPSILSYFSSLFPETEVSAKLRDEIEGIKEKLSKDNISDKDKKFYEDLLKKRQAELMKMPVKEVFEKIFSGEYDDSSYLQAFLNAPALNNHPLVASTFYLLRSMDIQTSQDMLHIENEHDKRFRRATTFVKSGLRDPRETWKDITDVVEYVTKVEEDGKLTNSSTRMLSSSYLPSYLSEHFKYAALEDFYRGKMFEARRSNDEANYDHYYELYENQTKARQSFQKENSERRYSDEVYDMYALLDKKITLPDGKYTTFRKERGDIFRDLEELENKRNQAPTIEDQKEMQDKIRIKNIELRELRSIWDGVTGKKKEGVPLALAEVATEYFEARGKYGKSLLTPEGKASFDRVMLYYKDQLDRGFITKDQYDAAINDNTITELDEEYFNKINEFSALIQEATEKLISVPELKPILGKINRDNIKEGYAKIKLLTQAFRDNDGIIDGILFSHVRPELIVQIRDIQQELEDLKNKASRLKGLSIEESVELDELTKKEIDHSISTDEQDRANSLRAEKAERRDIYKRNKTLIDGYYDLISGLSDLIDSSPSEYYEEEINNQINEISSKLKEEVRKEILYNGSLEDGTYFRRDDKWYKVTNKDEKTGETEIKEIIDKEGYPAIDQIVDEVVKSRSQDLLKNSQWWKDNHYTYYDFDKVSKAYFPSEKPIYIWVRTLPKNKEYVKANQPSWKFKTYKINDTYVNPDHKEIYPYVPINKADKYANQKYFDLQKSNPQLSNYLEFLRSEYHTHQQTYPPEKFVGDILPGMVATEDELKVITTKGLLLKSTYKKIFNLSSEQDQQATEDSKLLLHKSQSKFYSDKRILPTRFTGRVPIEKQSADVPAMILAFILGTKKYGNMSSIHPLLESLRTVTESLPVQETHNLGKKFSLGNLMSVIKGANNKVTTEKHGKESNLSKTINFVIDTFMYEQAKNPSVSTIMGMKADWQVMSRDLKKLASFALFSLKPFIAIKNTLSNKVQVVINSNIGKGFYTNTDIAKGQWMAKNYVGNFVKDYRKFGDKSFIGQMLEYFQVLHGDVYNKYGRRTQWTELKNVWDYLSIMKNISEFEVQITQFLAMANANKVLLNGKAVSLLDAFELNKDRNLVMKEGVTTMDNKAVDKKWLDSFIMRVGWVNRNINGAYRHDERNMAQKTVLGDLAFYLNGYVFPGLYNRYSGMSYSVESQQIMRGYWSQSFGFLRDLAKYRRGLNTQWKDMRPEERARVHRFLKEMGFIFALFFLGLAMGSGDDKKKLQQNSAFYNYMLALAMTVKSETETFFPAPSMGLNELSRKINSPFAALRQVSMLIQTMDNAFKYVIGADSGFYQKTGVHDGFHDKGDAKVVANFLKLIGWSGYEFDPLQRVGVVKRATQLR